MESLSERLDGKVILRFVLAGRSGGGVEEHLRYANRGLLERNRITVIQLYPDSGTNRRISEEIIGKGRVIFVPVKPSRIREADRRSQVTTFLRYIRWLPDGRPRRIASKVIGSAISAPYLRNKGKSLSFACHEPGKIVDRLSKEYAFHLAVLHSTGSLDDLEIVDVLRRLHVPVAFIHHYENRRLTHPLLRVLFRGVSAVGGVSSVDVPRYLRDRFLLVKEGIDTEFLQIRHASGTGCGRRNLILLPARIAASKGHLDLIEAARLLKRDGLNVTLAFAGRTDSENTMERVASAAGLLQDPQQVLFLGDLDRVSLRDWYAACDVVALPSYAEGLGRVLLEGQAMTRPVVAYGVGGIPEAVMHGEGGYLVRKGDISGLAKRLHDLLIDEPSRDRMGKQGRAFVEKRFSIASCAESHEEVYLAALGAGSCKSRSLQGESCCERGYAG